VNDWLLGDWCFGNARRSYRRARVNEARASAEASVERAASVAGAVASLHGDDAFLLGTLPNGTPVKVAPREVGRHAMVWGASGAGKSYGLHVVSEGWTERGRRLELIDPKGETFLLKAMHIAARYLALPEEKRDVFAARFRVLDVTEDRVTPADLFRVPAGMSPALLASLRAAAVSDLSSHAYSDLMAYGMFLLFSAVINLAWGVTVRIARAFFLDASFRERIVARITDDRLKDSVAHLETTLPEQTRKAIVRQFDILLASAPARVSFGLSPSMVAELCPHPDTSSITLGNFGPTPQRPPALAKAMATNRLIDVLNEVSIREKRVPEMLLLEEVGVLVKQPAVADYLLEASRTLRWKGLSIVCVAQDPSNAIPKETCTALVLNSKWLLAFECGRDEALWLAPHMAPRGKDDAAERRAFIAEMAKLPTQEAVFVRKGLPGFRLRLRDVEDPIRRHPREKLLETFYTKIASRSTVPMADAEARIAAFEATLFEKRETPGATDTPAARRPSPHTTSIDDFFATLRRAREQETDE
jgi:hypothetical protein